MRISVCALPLTRFIYWKWSYIPVLWGKQGHAALLIPWRDFFQKHQKDVKKRLPLVLVSVILGINKSKKNFFFFFWIVVVSEMALDISYFLKYVLHSEVICDVCPWIFFFFPSWLSNTFVILCCQTKRWLWMWVFRTLILLYWRSLDWV